MIDQAIQNNGVPKGTPLFCLAFFLQIPFLTDQAADHPEQDDERAKHQEKPEREKKDGKHYCYDKQSSNDQYDPFPDPHANSSIHYPVHIWG